MPPSPPKPVTAFIALGSNLEHPLEQVQSALTALGTIESSSLIAVSSWYRSCAVGPGDQPDYINGAAEIQTTLGSIQLLDAIQTIENQHGRKRSIRWGARTLDLDILLYGNQTMDTERLQVPHPRLVERNFVLYPLAELAPELTLPDGSIVSALAQQVGGDGLTKLGGFESP